MCGAKKADGVKFLPNMRKCHECFKQLQRVYNKDFYNRHKEERKTLNNNIPPKKKLKYKINVMKNKMEILKKKIEESQKMYDEMED
jgi:hypothetical protein